jgi:hypothetical protein
LVPPKNEGFIEYVYERDGWTYHDSYLGEINAPGREVIYYQNEPVWTMAYRSKILTNDFSIVNQIYDFLREALRNNTKEMPFRGPKEFEYGDFNYSFVIQEGDYKSFLGREEIYYKGQLVYVNRTMGGIIEN